MKVNFLGLFRETHKLVSASIRGTNNAPGFQELLSDISPDKPQVVESIPPVNAGKISLPVFETEVRAQFDFSRPELKPPPVERVGLAAQSAKEAAKEGGGVKTPTILSAKRVPVGDAFQGLKHNERVERVKKMAETAGLKHGVDPALSIAVVSVESSFDPSAVSTDGHFSKGLMQLLDETGRQELERSGMRKGYEPFDPASNVDLGVSYLRYLHDAFSRETELANKSKTVAAANSSSLEKLAVAAFNAGEGRVAAAQERALKAMKDAALYEDVEMYLPESTQEYVRKVLAAKARLEERFIG